MAQGTIERVFAEAGARADALLPDNAMNLTPNSVEAAAFEHGRGICEHRHRAFLEARSQLRCDSGLLVEQAEQYAFLCPDSLRSLRTL